jgi:hypothetical protein
MKSKQMLKTYGIIYKNILWKQQKRVYGTYRCNTKWIALSFDIMEVRKCLREIKLLTEDC